MDRYVELVRQSASELGKVFMLDSGEGNDWGTPEDEWYVEELSGWLIDPREADRFLAIWNEGAQKAIRRSGEWDDCYYYVYWQLRHDVIPGEPPVTVRFEKATRYG